MNIAPDGPFAGGDKAAVARLDELRGFSSYPATMVLVTYWTFLVCLVMAAVVSRFFAPGGVRDLIVISLPLLTLALHVGITYLVYRACDEYLRQRILRCAAAAGVVLAFGAVADFCLERLGHPYLPLGAVNLCGWSLFIVLMLWVRRRAR